MEQFPADDKACDGFYFRIERKGGLSAPFRIKIEGGKVVERVLMDAENIIESAHKAVWVGIQKQFDGVEP